jgi:L-threonylcarbamoyladenylate synthase
MKRVFLDSSTNTADLAGEVLQRVSGGEIVLLPTETQYGLCCDAEIGDSVQELNRIKGRSMLMPSAVFVEDWLHGSDLVESPPDGIERFLLHFWPGPLTVILKSSRVGWPGVVSPEGAIGLRCSSHPLLVRIQEQARVYLTATSANPHGKQPLSDPEIITNWLAGHVELFIFDRDVREGAQASTVVDVTTGTPQVLRAGAIAADEILMIWKKEIAGA